MTFDNGGGLDLIPDATVDERDARTAQTILDAWAGSAWPLSLEHGPALLELRGILTVALADTRAAGVLEGHRAGLLEGRRGAVQDLRCALEDAELAW